MRAKFIHESVGDILRPKTQEQIANDISKLSQQELNNKLIEASDNGQVEIVKLLLGAGADVEAKDNIIGWTALILASDKGHVEIVKLLLEAGANVGAKDNSGWTALTYASSNDHVDVVRLLKKYGAKK